MPSQTLHFRFSPSSFKNPRQPSWSHFIEIGVEIRCVCVRVIYPTLDSSYSKSLISSFLLRISVSIFLVFRNASRLPFSISTAWSVEGNIEICCSKSNFFCKALNPTFTVDGGNISMMKLVVKCFLQTIQCHKGNSACWQRYVFRQETHEECSEDCE